MFITDEAPRDVANDGTARIRAAIRRMPIPTYAAVVTETDPQNSPDRLTAPLHDKHWS